MSKAENLIPFRVGAWLPSDQKFLNNWLKNLIKEVDAAPKPLHPVVQELKDLIESDAQIYMLVNMMLEQVPAKYQHSQYGKQVRDYHHLLQLINAIMTQAPTYNTTGCVGFPINAILDWSMGTEGGFAAFLNEKLNAQLKKVINEWGIFLKSKDSVYVVDEKAPSGWLSDNAMVGMFPPPNFPPNPTAKDIKNAAPQARLDFIAAFQCEPAKPHWGYTSWDDFFTRQFNEGQRPIASPDDDSVIVNACESAPYNLVSDVQRLSKFWIKAQPYSLQLMLHNDVLVEKFVGGTIYQAFLSAMSYHRWHSPLSGKVVKAYVQDGTYYSEAPAEGYDPAGPNSSQGYITEVAARAMIFIEADNPAIGLMCIMFVGMAEVSSCDITVYEGQHVNKGEQLGMFHFGGSSHCLIFRPGVKLEFDLHGQTPGLDSSNIPINSKIAKVKTKKVGK
ncbi:MAG: phosphatidylserine decarboxylase family protein [Sideroxydans sp.]|nr:phosphatidylserine decarboxylase family protein [Sideroxydans sp.]